MVSFACEEIPQHSPSTEKSYQSMVALLLPESDRETIPWNHGFFVFCFTLPSDRDRALLDGTLVVDDATISLQP